MAEEEIKKTRKEKLQRLRAMGMNPYPRVVTRTSTIAELHAAFENAAKEKQRVTVVGRMMALRRHGGSSFVHIRDGTGKIQCYLKRDVLGEEAYKLWEDVLDIGDIVGITGFPFYTQKGEPTVEAVSVTMLAKSLLPLPEKWYGLQNVEERYRKRYIDLLVNDDVKERFLKRSAVIRAVRSFLWKENFMEAETPILQPIPGGATARPFETRLNALNMKLYLRIAPELYLKRLLVAGFEKIFEIGRNFRNEGMDREHNPEFTMIECYIAYFDDDKLIGFIERMVHSVIKDVFGTLEIRHKDATINFTPPWRQVFFSDLLRERTGIDYGKEDRTRFINKAKGMGIEVDDKMSKGKIADEIFKKAIRPHILSPLVVRHHPIDISPLAKRREKSPNEVARFQILAGGMELVNGFAELNDPEEQKRRLAEQEKTRIHGDEEAQRMDVDFLEALAYGMPPAAGFGMGIDRLAAILTDAGSLREIILFPAMRPKRPAPRRDEAQT